MVQRVHTDYSSLPPQYLRQFCHRVATSLAASPYFPDANKLIAPLLTVLSCLDIPDNEVADSAAALLRPEIRQQLLAALENLAVIVNARYAGYGNALRSTGLPLASEFCPDSQPAESWWLRLG